MNTLFQKPEISWTQHVKMKMQYYRLSEGRIKRILRHPQRTEKGIASGTVACMQRNDSKKKQEELWVMYADFKSKGNPQRKVISAWRYPGQSPEGEPILIPVDVLEELKKLKQIK